MKYKITVANLNKTKSGIRCDRKSPLGNPFYLIHEYQRDTVISAYRTYLYKIIFKDMTPKESAISLNLPIANTWQIPTTTEFTKELYRIYINSLYQDTTLLCWCHPLPCHCDVIVNYLQYLSTLPTPE